MAVSMSVVFAVNAVATMAGAIQLAAAYLGSDMILLEISRDDALSVPRYWWATGMRDPDVPDYVIA
jgi:hypothetical protein